MTAKTKEIAVVTKVRALVSKVFLFDSVAENRIYGSYKVAKWDNEIAVVEDAPNAE